jgi:hypothetical protein
MLKSYGKNNLWRHHFALGRGIRLVVLQIRNSKKNLKRNKVSEPSGTFFFFLWLV